MKNKKILKIIVPLVMLSFIVLIWISSNSNDEIDTSDFALHATSIDLETLTSYGMPIIIDFGADECVPCKEMAPVLVKVNEDMQNKAIIKFVDVWKNPEAASGFPVQVIPTQIFINFDGTPYIPSEDLGIEFLSYVDVDTQEPIFTAHQGGLTEEEMLLIVNDMLAIQDKG